MKMHLAALVSGLLFGLGLGVSQMIDRARVLGFLDVTGAWDPALMFVLGGAVGVTVILFRVVVRRSKPLFDEMFHLPMKKQIDSRLIWGAAMFGIGWGLAGYCPGPAITSLTLGSWNPVLFMVAFAAGSYLARLFERCGAKPEDA